MFDAWKEVHKQSPKWWFHGEFTMVQDPQKNIFNTSQINMLNQPPSFNNHDFLNLNVPNWNTALPKETSPFPHQWPHMAHSKLDGNSYVGFVFFSIPYDSVEMFIP